MRKLLVLSLFLFLGVLSPVRAQQAPSTAHLGRKIPNLAFADHTGKAFQLYDLKDPKAVVIVFLSFECPVSNSYCEPLANLHQVYHKQGVYFLGLTVNEDETRRQVAKFAEEYKVPFPVFKDENHRAVAALKADVTPEAFVLDHNFVLRYRGRIDNAYAERLKRHTEVTEHNLDRSIAELLAGRPISEPTTLPIGCFIARPERPQVANPKATYHRDVVPILQNHCQSCHRPGEVGPFSLMTYKQAVNWADDIKQFTRERWMPPWKPSAGVAFHNDRRMPQKDIDLLAAWVDDGCPEGDPKDAPPPREFVQGWQLGQPDLVLSASADFQLGASGRDLFRCFVLPTNLPEDTYVAAVEVRPSNPRVVHHVLLFVDGTGRARQLEMNQQKKKFTELDEQPNEDDRGPGYTVAMGVGFLPQGGLGGWAPGNLMRRLPEDSGFFLPKGADVVMQVHFHRNGRVEKDRTQVGLYFAKKGQRKPYQGHVLAGGTGAVGPLRLFFSIPAGAENFELTGDLWAREDFNLVALTPHMHMLGKSLTVTFTPPDGPTRTILTIPDWDYNWQESYFLKEPLRIPAGSKLSVTATYDNSSKNPRNPFHPPRRITFGEQTNNEMCFVFLGGLSNSPTRNLPLTPFPPTK